MIKISKYPNQLYITLSILAIVLGTYFSYKLHWFGDDIFTGFRYVQNFINGNGLVYNKGERVEGYTDFLWLMLLSFFGLLKFNLPIVAGVLGILFSTGTLVLFSIIGSKVSFQNKKSFIPFITIALAINYDYNVWATSGLEVSFVTFLLSVAFYIYFFSELKTNKRLVLTGLFICLALLTRPDVMLILITANILLLIGNIAKREKLIELIKSHCLFNASILVIYLPYFLWRYNYYGFIFPNTYYMKLADEWNFYNGFYYIYLYFKVHYTSFLIIIIPIYLLIRLLKKGELKQFLFNKNNAAFISSLFIIFIYLICFVAKVGGDFMYARFIIPCIPFIYFIIFYFVNALIISKHKVLILCAIILLCGSETYLRINLYKGGCMAEDINGVGDERFWYTHCYDVCTQVNRAKQLGKYFNGINCKVLIVGCQDRLAFYSNFDYCQEFYGLTDTLIAHSKTNIWGRIGHKKHAAIEYIESKRINFSFDAPILKEDWYRFASINLPSDTVPIEIITYDNAIINKIVQRAGKDFHYTNFPAYLDTYINDTLPTIKSYNQLDKDYKNFYAYYFKNNDDKPRESIFKNALEKLK